MPTPSIRHPFFFLFLLLWLGLIGLEDIIPAAFPGQPPVAVLYPEVREPYRSVFLDIAKGIENKLNGPINTYVLEKNYDLAAIKAQLASDQVQMVIALGSRGLLAAKSLSPGFKVIVGAVLINPNSENMIGISLVPDPGELFRWLKKLVPKVKRITVIYSQEQNGWLIDRARENASDEKLEFNAFPVTSIHEAAALYRNTLNTLQSGVDAIWLPQDEMLDERAILSLILQAAWDRDLLVFSSSLAHIKRGALFALYPDNEGMGRRLAELAEQWRSRGKVPEGIRPLQNLLGAVNVRTAEHLGLKFTSRQMREFELVFPAR